MYIYIYWSDRAKGAQMATEKKTPFPLSATIEELICILCRHVVLKNLEFKKKSKIFFL